MHLDAALSESQRCLKHSDSTVDWTRASAADLDTQLSVEGRLRLVALRCAARQRFLPDALHRRDPGAWRFCYRLSSQPRPLDQVLIEQLPDHVRARGHLCVVGPS